MAKLVHENQQCSIAGRKILNHYLHFIRDIITYTQEKQTQTAIISLDQKKGFDKIAHDYLFQKHNLGAQMETWIKTLQKTAKPNPHTLSEPFTLTPSIRHGCSLSPLLYVLSIEPSQEYIRQKIPGIDIPGPKKRKRLRLKPTMKLSLLKQIMKYNKL